MSRQQHKKPGPEPTPAPEALADRAFAPPPGQAAPVAQAQPEAAPVAGHSIAAAPARLSGGGLLQPKLTLGGVGDSYEREADAVASRVAGGLSAPRIQRASASGAGASVTPEVEAGVAGMRGGGRPLDAATRGAMETHMGHDFSQVRIHTDARAAQVADQIRAHAFTVGSDIAFAPGQYQPASSEGRKLLAHELTHVVQQGAGGERIQRAFIKDADSDAELFEMAPGGNDQPDLSAHTEEKKGKLKITSVAMKHFLERHTFKHQQLSADFRRFDATLWPIGTTVTEVLEGLTQALKAMQGRSNKNKMVNQIQTVTMGGKSCQVQIGMITGGKLEQFFPVSGDGCQQYTKQELAQIYAAKQRKPKAKPTTAEQTSTVSGASGGTTMATTGATATVSSGN